MVVDLMRWNLLQLLVIPAWIGDGVSIPLVGLVDCVGVAVCPMTDTQTQTSAHNPEQPVPSLGFQVVNWARVMPCLEETALQLSPCSTK